MGTHKNSTIGLCVVCGPYFIEGLVPMGKVGRVLTNTKGPSEVTYADCKACNGQGYTYYRSGKK